MLALENVDEKTEESSKVRSQKKNLLLQYLG